MRWRLVLLIVCGLLLAACGGTTPAASPAGETGPIASDSKLLDRAGRVPPPDGALAPDFQFSMADGTTRKLSDFRGKKVLLNFWATWCYPCRTEMPDLQRAAQTAGSSVVVLGVDQFEQPPQIAQFGHDLQISFLLIPNTSGDISDRYGAHNPPTTFFLNRDGTVAAERIGMMDYSFITQQLQQLR